MIISCW